MAHCAWGEHASVGRLVPGTGPLDATVVFVGEAPGSDEERVGVPFVGASGTFLWDGFRDTKWKGLRGRGWDRVSVRVDNVRQIRPLENNLLHVTPEQMERSVASLHERAAAWTGARVIVPLGNLALNALRRRPLPVKKRGGWRTKRIDGRVVIDWVDKIGTWRGSVSRYTFNDGRRAWIIPTYHPAYVLRNGEVLAVWKGDWGKVESAMVDGFARWPRPRVTIEPSQADLADWREKINLAHALQNDPVLSIDIENAGEFIQCVGYALTPDEALVVGPETRGFYAFVRWTLDHPIAKAFHFGVHDTNLLTKKFGRVRNWKWDTQHLHHLLDPRDRHSLAYCASRDLRVAYWKDERKEEGLG